ncbi:hypothetical protein [Wolbachia endosymbiont of Pentidionis agamae]|uniref:hypothetical protein n=1 Tax=Wolbachia endosymbiont of Pentidionis agamae TaxID=3110435 RepID=UPI002FCF27A0
MIKGIHCIIQSPSGADYFLKSNPGTITVQRWSGLLSIDCKKSGYNRLDTMVEESFNTVTLLNIIWWPGFAVDAVTGAYKKYPSYYLVVMENSD